MEYEVMDEKNELRNAGALKENIAAIIIKLMSVLVMVAGTIGSLFIANVGYNFETARFWAAEIGAITVGMLIYGQGEVIRLLQDIKNKMK
jgi:hypothetical protein